MKYVILKKAIHTIAIDFDGTIIPHNLGGPIRLDPLPGAREEIEKFKKNGWIIIVYTCRSDSQIPEIANFLRRNGIPFDYINENPLQNQLTPKKLYADMYLDDKAVTFKRWHGAYEEVVKRRMELDKLRGE
jgi:hydroxymethylpyrimidine pyrophosphatase-like HAD family hydrolase